MGPTSTVLSDKGLPPLPVDAFLPMSCLPIQCKKLSSHDLEEKYFRTEKIEPNCA